MQEKDRLRRKLQEDIYHTKMDMLQHVEDDVRSRPRPAIPAAPRPYAALSAAHAQRSSSLRRSLARTRDCSQLKRLCAGACAAQEADARYDHREQHVGAPPLFSRSFAVAALCCCCPNRCRSCLTEPQPADRPAFWLPPSPVCLIAALAAGTGYGPDLERQAGAQHNGQVHPYG